MNDNFRLHQLIPMPLPYVCLLPIKKVMIQIHLVATFMKENMIEVRISRDAQCGKTRNFPSPKMFFVKLTLVTSFVKTLLSRNFWQKFRESNVFTKEITKELN